jgi:hypothetical protein
MAAFITIAVSILTQLFAAAVAIFRAIPWTSCVPLWLVAVLTVAAWHFGGASDENRADGVERTPIVRPDRPRIFPIFNRAPAASAADCICVDCTCIECPTDCPTPDDTKKAHIVNADGTQEHRPLTPDEEEQLAPMTEAEFIAFQQWLKTQPRRSYIDGRLLPVPDPISTPQDDEQAADEEPKAAAAVAPRTQAPQPSRSYRAAGLFGFRRLPGASSCGPNGCR